MLYTLGRIIWHLWCGLELVVFSLLLYGLSWLPPVMITCFYHRLFRLWCKSFVLALGVNLKIHQKHAGPIPNHFILIANHPSAFEDVGIPALFDVYPLAKQGVRDWFVVGRISQAAGTIYVNRTDPDSRHTAADKLIALVNQGKNISLFPEGGCKGRRLNANFEFGAFNISLKTGVPILPVFLHYESQETFEWQDPHTLLHKIWHFLTSQNNRAHYYVFDAIDPKQFSNKEDYAAYVHRLYLTWQTRYLE